MMTHISDAFDMTAATLWVVWSHVSPVDQALGRTREKVVCRWTLASAGEQGLVDIKGPRGLPTGFIAAAPLQALQMVVEAPVPHANRPQWMKAFLPNLDSARLFQLANGDMEWVFSGDPSPPDAVLLCEGKREDLLELVRQGESLLATQNYRDVFGDSRPISEGHPANWILHKRNPSAMAQLDAWIAEEEARQARA